MIFSWAVVEISLVLALSFPAWTGFSGKVAGAAHG
jgi:hypothetical protein